MVDAIYEELHRAVLRAQPQLDWGPTQIQLGREQPRPLFEVLVEYSSTRALGRTLPRREEPVPL